MDILNFTQIELEGYYNNNQTIFVNYRKIFKLEYSKNCGYFFYLIPQSILPNNALPYTKKGKYHVFTPYEKIVKELLPNFNN